MEALQEVSHIENILSVVNEYIISSLEINAFFRHIYCAKEISTTGGLIDAISSYFICWESNKVHSLCMRINALHAMAEKNELLGWVDFENGEMVMQRSILLAAAQCPMTNINNQIVFEKAYLIERAIHIHKHLIGIS